MPGYIPAELRRQIRANANARCGYCHTPEELIGMPLEIEHLLPEALGGPIIQDNLWPACSRCNSFKGDRIAATDPQFGERALLFNPRDQSWTEQFRWALDGITIVGITATGRATVEALRLNNEYILVARRFWLMAGRWPPPEDSAS